MTAHPATGKILATIIGIIVAFVTSVFVEYSGSALISAMFGSGQKSLYGASIILAGAMLATLAGSWAAVRCARAYSPAYVVTLVCIIINLTYVWLQTGVVRGNVFIPMHPFNWVMGALAIAVPLLALCIVRVGVRFRR